MPIIHCYVSNETMHWLIKAGREFRNKGDEKTDATSVAENAIEEAVLQYKKSKEK